ncbi:hypothetical protein [Idiomarina sp.]|uniref:hypothetical protein n=1 Tax=Idiomarina sp. TaxID=1874361 RepID=UPI0025C604C5|nr:hypothetical protein [Idiomarina sp.]
MKKLKKQIEALRLRNDARRGEIRDAEFNDPDNSKKARLRSLLDEDERALESLEHEAHYVFDKIKSADASFDTLNKTILSLATTALGFTITFSGDLIPKEPNATWLIATSWSLFSFSIIFIVLGIFLGIKADIKAKEDDTTLYSLSGFMSGLGFISFPMGMLGLTAFAILNITSLI